MSVYGGFALRRSEAKYNQYLEHLLFVLQSKLLDIFSKKVGQQNLLTDEFKREFGKTLFQMRIMEKHKYLPPKFSLSVNSLAEFLGLDQQQLQQEDISISGSILHYDVNNNPKINSGLSSQVQVSSSPTPPLNSSNRHSPTPRNQIQKQNTSNSDFLVKQPRKSPLSRPSTNKNNKSLQLQIGDSTHKSQEPQVRKESFILPNPPSQESPKNNTATFTRNKRSDLIQSSQAVTTPKQQGSHQFDMRHTGQAKQYDSIQDYSAQSLEKARNLKNKGFDNLSDRSHKIRSEISRKNIISEEFMEQKTQFNLQSISFQSLNQQPLLQEDSLQQQESTQQYGEEYITLENNSFENNQMQMSENFQQNYLLPFLKPTNTNKNNLKGKKRTQSFQMSNGFSPSQGDSFQRIQQKSNLKQN